jgi:hypothetical protein
MAPITNIRKQKLLNTETQKNSSITVKMNAPRHFYKESPTEYTDYSPCKAIRTLKYVNKSSLPIWTSQGTWARNNVAIH